MRKFGLLVLGLLLCGTANVNAQVMEEPEENLDGFYVKSSDAYPDGKKPFEYPYVREDDVVWSYRVWRVIDFQRKDEPSVLLSPCTRPRTKEPHDHFGRSIDRRTYQSFRRRYVYSGDNKLDGI